MFQINDDQCVFGHLKLLRLMKIRGGKRGEREREREREEGRGERMVSCDLRFANVSFSVQARPDSPSGAYVDDYCKDTDITTYLH